MKLGQKCQMSNVIRKRNKSNQDPFLVTVIGGLDTLGRFPSFFLQWKQLL